MGYRCPLQSFSDWRVRVNNTLKSNSQLRKDFLTASFNLYLKNTVDMLTKIKARFLQNKVSFALVIPFYIMIRLINQ